MNQFALGLIETIGYTTAVSAADAALKAANVSLIGVERVIGVGGALGVTIHLSGDVGAVKSAVEAGKMEAERVGKVISAHVIPRAHTEVNDKLLPFFSFDQRVETKPSSDTAGKRGKRKLKTNQAKEEATDHSNDMNHEQ